MLRDRDLFLSLGLFAGNLGLVARSVVLMETVSEQGSNLFSGASLRDFPPSTGFVFDKGAFRAGFSDNLEDFGDDGALVGFALRLLVLVKEHTDGDLEPLIAYRLEDFTLILAADDRVFGRDKVVGELFEGMLSNALGGWNGTDRRRGRRRHGIG